VRSDRKGLPYLSSKSRLVIYIRLQSYLIAIYFWTPFIYNAAKRKYGDPTYKHDVWQLTNWTDIFVQHVVTLMISWILDHVTMFCSFSTLHWDSVYFVVPAFCMRGTDVSDKFLRSFQKIFESLLRIKLPIYSIKHNSMMYSGVQI